MPTPVQPSRGDARDTSAEPVKRKLLVGAALLLALASIYAGMFDVGKLAQVMLATAATIAVVWALTSRSR